MAWYSLPVARLEAGETVAFRPRGNSMVPIIRSGQLCTVEPLNGTPPAVGDVVLAKVRGSFYLHKVTAAQAGRCQIGNNHGHVNGWASRVYGRLVRVEA